MHVSRRGANTAEAISENPSAGVKTFIPGITLPKGGGAVKGIDEKFSVNAASGALSFSIPLPVAQGRGFVPELRLNYNSGAGNGPYGFGWEVNLPSVFRKTEKGLPLYQDDADTFVLTGAEDLVPLLIPEGGSWRLKTASRSLAGEGLFKVTCYRPRIEGAFHLIEHWQHQSGNGSHWRTISPGNVTSIFGKSAGARLSDPADPARIYQWLLERSYDDKGHLIEYEYKPEDIEGYPRSLLHNRNRRSGGNLTCTNLCPTRIRYGNTQSFAGGRSGQGGYTGGFLFETAFDYGEYSDAEPWTGVRQPWEYRRDGFSTYRAGFEIRTTRRCKRVLLFHHVPDSGPQKGYDGLVSALALGYGINASSPQSDWQDGAAAFDAMQPDSFSFLTTLASSGYKRNDDGSYSAKDFPPALLSYQTHRWNMDVRVAGKDSLRDLPVGVHDAAYVLTDLYGEGIAGILSEDSGGALRYKEALGEGHFAAAKLISPQPNYSGLRTGALQLADLEGNGECQLVQAESGRGGFFPLNAAGSWDPYQPFNAQPVVDFDDPNLRFVDLDGDGRPDILITEGDVFRWYPSKGKKGFGASRTLPAAVSEESGPVLLFAGSVQTIFLADMSGDGLADLVRIRNGDICYWPNLGYGRFGAKVGMDNAPVFADAASYDPSLLRLADIDGSGLADIIYLGGNGCSCWLNQSGNSWPQVPVEIPLPPIDDLSTVSVADLLGTGTACIIWSSPLPGNEGAQLRYINLMDGRKPHLLCRFENNLGKEVDFTFKPSTCYYLDDKAQGWPWSTKLPFPVHCIAGVTVRDRIRDTVFASTYSYHHGCYDYGEREFRGFGRVEQQDTETFSLFSRREGQNVLEEVHHQPPVRSVIWFHNGQWAENGKLLHQHGSEYFSNAFAAEHPLPEPALPAGLSAGAYSEALRALKGLALRHEIYAEDGSPQEAFPFSVSTSTYSLRLIQPSAAGNRHASFQVLAGQQLSYDYDRDPADPRITHTLMLEANEFGQPLLAASVVYPRLARPAGALPDELWAAQSRGHIFLAESAYTNDLNDQVLLPDDYRLRASCEEKRYELLGLALSAAVPATAEGLLAACRSATTLPFEADGDGSLQKRLTKHRRAYFLQDDLSAALPLGILPRLGLPAREMHLAFTQGLVAEHYGAKVPDAMLASSGYEHSEGDNGWWIPGGTNSYPADAPAQFYLPDASRDALGAVSRIVYDAFKLLVVSATDPVGNTVNALPDYRMLQPALVEDANGNRSAVETDAAGMVVKTALMGKAGAGEGDTLNDPTTRIEYDLHQWRLHRKPAYAHASMREQHGAAGTSWQESYAYSDGSGAVIMVKQQAGPGEALRWNEATGSLETVGDAASPRWTGNGRTVLNNKGNPVKQYEPYFSTTHEYESEAALVTIGQSPVHYYDAAGRNIRTDRPDGVFTKTVYSPWLTKLYDANDTVRDSAWYAALGSPDPAGPEPATPQRRAAWLAARHHDTPSLTHADSLGRPVCVISDYGSGRTAAVRTENDPAGRYARIFDQRNRPVSSSYNNMAGAAIRTESAEKGERWILTDVAGRLVRMWEDGGREYRATYDGAHRPLSAFLREGTREWCFNHTVYGDQLPDAAARSLNLKGLAFRVYDSAGMIGLRGLDFTGHPTGVERRLAKDYKGAPDWSALGSTTDPALIAAAAAELLEEELFTASAIYDALGRPVTALLADGTELGTGYDAGNTLQRIDARIGGSGPSVPFLLRQDYDAKGQRQRAAYGNGLITHYAYDPATSRLQELQTFRSGADSAAQALQDLRYTYDPAGNITHIEDAAQQTHFFDNAMVGPGQSFAYDALYQLISATGREHAGLSPSQPADGEAALLVPLPSTASAGAVRAYTERYEYDVLGNLLKMRHVAGGAGSWTRLYRYAQDADAADRTNRLIATNKPAEQTGALSDTGYAYDAAGNMTAMPHLRSLVWDFTDRLNAVDLTGGGKAYYVYGTGGHRIRKVIERPGGLVQERIYLGGVEIYRERRGTASPHLQRNTIHIHDNAGRIAHVDVKVRDDDGSDAGNPLLAPLIRYQYGNHIGSAVLETDGAGVLISYEEYHPFGTTAYAVAASAAGKSLKRYRFSGKERDDETGLYYFGARYYAAWLGRWTSADPAGFADGLNQYRYCRNNPVCYADKWGA